MKWKKIFIVVFMILVIVMCCSEHISCNAVCSINSEPKEFKQLAENLFVCTFDTYTIELQNETNNIIENFCKTHNRIRSIEIIPIGVDTSSNRRVCYYIVTE